MNDQGISNFLMTIVKRKSGAEMHDVLTIAPWQRPVNHMLSRAQKKRPIWNRHGVGANTGMSGPTLVAN